VPDAALERNPRDDLAGPGRGSCSSYDRNVAHPPVFIPADEEMLVGEFTAPPTVGIDRNGRLKKFWNSARTLRLYRTSLPIRKFRPKLIDSAGWRCQR
jgi:hypothetical protein